MTGQEILDWAVNAGFTCVFVAVALAFFRLVKGPSLPDRVVALDVITVAIVAFCGLAAIRSGDPAFLDVALVLALVGFLATVALARFAERYVDRRARALEEQKEREE
ncbi:MAG: monovalent cation/H+ antiporter complex subunit F [Rhodobacteraceae bacterium]|nr:monovalent cation/H+ antiporter complex subunit F [Paracoccaceae bacterium]